MICFSVARACITFWHESMICARPHDKAEPYRLSHTASTETVRCALHQARASTSAQAKSILEASQKHQGDTYAHEGGEQRASADKTNIHLSLSAVGCEGAVDNVPGGSPGARQAFCGCLCALWARSRQSAVSALVLINLATLETLEQICMRCVCVMDQSAATLDNERRMSMTQFLNRHGHQLPKC